MNHTPNYSLSQWDADDRILMDDFNADNAKIDGAIKAVNDRADALASKTELDEVRALAARSRFTRLWELILTASSSEIIIPLTGIDWNKWDKVHLDIKPNNGQVMRVYFNQVVSQTYKFSITGEKDHFNARITFHVGHNADRFVHANRAGTWVYLGKPFTELKQLIINESTMDPGAIFILWGEE